MAKVSLKERFWSKVALPDPYGCMLWTGCKFRGGHGMFKIDGKNVGAHRVAYELSVGPIPEGLHIDHLCRVRHCVTPDHMEPVTPQENTRRGNLWMRRGSHERAKTHCPKGHPYDDENTNRRKGRGNTLRRDCRECHRARSKAWKQARKAQKP